MTSSSDILAEVGENEQIKETLRCVLIKQGETVLQLLEGALELRVEQIAEIKAFVRNANALSSGLRGKALISAASGQEYSSAVEDALREELAINCDEIYARFLPFWKDLRRSRKEGTSSETDAHWEQLSREIVALWEVMEKVYEAVKAELNPSNASFEDPNGPTQSSRSSMSTALLSLRSHGRHNTASSSSSSAAMLSTSPSPAPSIVTAGERALVNSASPMTREGSFSWFRNGGAFLAASFRRIPGSIARASPLSSNPDHLSDPTLVASTNPFLGLATPISRSEVSLEPPNELLHRGGPRRLCAEPHSFTSLPDRPTGLGIVIPEHPELGIPSTMTCSPSMTARRATETGAEREDAAGREPRPRWPKRTSSLADLSVPIPGSRRDTDRSPRDFCLSTPSSPSRTRRARHPLSSNRYSLFPSAPPSRSNSGVSRNTDQTFGTSSVGSTQHGKGL